MTGPCGAEAGGGRAARLSVESELSAPRRAPLVSERSTRSASALTAGQFHRLAVWGERDARASSRRRVLRGEGGGLQPRRSDQRLKLTHRRVREADGGSKNKPFKTPPAGKVIPSVLYLLNFWSSKTYCKHCCTYCSREKGQQEIFLIEQLVHFLGFANISSSYQKA